MEENANLNETSKYVKEMRTQVSANVSDQLWKSAKDHGIGWTDALEFGIRFLLAERDGGLEFNYPSCTLQDKLQRCTKTLNAKCQECDALRDQMPKQDVEEDLKDVGLD